MSEQSRDITPAELTAAVKHLRAGKPPIIRLATAAEVLEACKLGVITKAEARRLLGLRKRPQPKQLRRKP